MNEPERTKVVSVHKLRRRARAEERRLTRGLQRLAFLGERKLGESHSSLGLPVWARGVRVEKAGRFQWAVVATSRKGH